MKRPEPASYHYIEQFAPIDAAAVEREGNALVSWCNANGHSAVFRAEGEPGSVFEETVGQLATMGNRYDNLSGYVHEKIEQFTGSMSSNFMALEMSYRDNVDDISQTLKDGETCQYIVLRENGGIMDTGIQGQSLELHMFGNGRRTDDVELFMKALGGLKDERFVLIKLDAKGARDERAMDSDLTQNLSAGDTPAAFNDNDTATAPEQPQAETDAPAEQTAEQPQVAPQDAAPEQPVVAAAEADAPQALETATTETSAPVANAETVETAAVPETLEVAPVQAAMGEDAPATLDQIAFAEAGQNALSDIVPEAAPIAASEIAQSEATAQATPEAPLTAIDAAAPETLDVVKPTALDAKADAPAVADASNVVAFEAPEVPMAIEQAPLETSATKDIASVETSVELATPVAEIVKPETAVATVTATDDAPVTPARDVQDNVVSQPAASAQQQDPVAIAPVPEAPMTVATASLDMPSVEAPAAMTVAIERTAPETSIVVPAFVAAAAEPVTPVAPAQKQDIAVANDVAPPATTAPVAVTATVETPAQQTQSPQIIQPQEREASAAPQAQEAKAPVIQQDVAQTPITVQPTEITVATPAAASNVVVAKAEAVTPADSTPVAPPTISVVVETPSVPAPPLAPINERVEVTGPDATPINPANPVVDITVRTDTTTTKTDLPIGVNEASRQETVAPPPIENVIVQPTQDTAQPTKIVTNDNPRIVPEPNPQDKVPAQPEQKADEPKQVVPGGGGGHQPEPKQSEPRQELLKHHDITPELVLPPPPPPPPAETTNKCDGCHGEKGCCAIDFGQAALPERTPEETAKLVAERAAERAERAAMTARLASPALRR